MLLTLLAALVVGRQNNPAGTNVFPSQAAFYSSAGATALVEIQNSQGQVVPFVDAALVKRSAVSVTFASSNYEGLGWLVTQTAPDTTNLLNPISPSQYRLIISMVSGSVSVSPVGTYDSSAGSGRGILVGLPAPSATTPTVFTAGTTYRIDPGFVVSVVAGSALAPNAAKESGGNLATLAANAPIVVNPLTLGIFDVGGAGLTVYVEFVDSAAKSIALSDTTSTVKGTAFSFTVSAGGFSSFARAVSQLKPDGTHFLVLPTNPYGARIKVQSGIAPASGPSATLNTGGLPDGSAGTAGSGFNTGYAPSATTPWVIYQGSPIVVGGIAQ